MRDRAWRAGAVGTALAVMMLAGCGTSSTGAGAPAGSAPGATPSAGTAFDLPLPAAVRAIRFTDSTGKHLTLGSLAGTDLVITDFMTDCQEVCPMTSVNVRDAAKAAAAAGLDRSRVRFLEITIDPGRDTVAKLAAYRKLYGALPNWQLLTASPADIATLWTSLGVAVTKVPPASPPPKDWLTGKPLTYDLQHQDVVIAVDGDGHERWLEQGTPATQGVQPPAVLKAELDATGLANLTAPQGATWTVGDVDGALTWLTGTHVG